MKHLLAVLVSMLLASSVWAANPEFAIKQVQVQIYDTAHNKLLPKPLNPYGNDMELLVAVQIQQTSGVGRKYKVVVEGFGKGRNNEAEGSVPDYKERAERHLMIYSSPKPVFVPLILPFACTEKVAFKVTVTSEGGISQTKMVNTGYACSLN